MEHNGSEDDMWQCSRRSTTDVEGRPPHRGGIARLAALVVSVAVASALAACTDDSVSDDATPATVSSSTQPGDSSAVSSAPSAPAASSTSTAPTTTQATTTSAPTVELARPIIDVAWCRPTWAQTRDVVIEGAYVWPRQRGTVIQVFVPSGRRVAEQFAVALRITSGLRFSPESANAEVNGQPARSSFAKPTWGELLWPLPDGSEAYLRTSTMTSDELITLAETLEPRELAATLPGFDTTGTDYELVAQDVTPITIDGIVESACEPTQGGWMLVAVVDGPLAQAVFLTDRPAVPLATRALGDGRLVVVTGRDDIADRSQEVLDSLRDATDDEWAALSAVDPTSLDPNRVPSEDG